MLHDLRWKLQRWTTLPDHDAQANSLDHQVHINVDMLQVQGARREVTNNEIQTVCNVLRKLNAFNKLDDVGLQALSDLRDYSSVTLTAQAVLDAKTQTQAIRRRQAQQSRNDRAESARQRLDPSADPHARKLYQHIQKQRSPPTSTMWDEREGGYTANTNRILDLIEEAWHPVFD